MKVQLVNHSQGVNSENLLEMVAYCARVSNPENQEHPDNSKKLVQYLIKNNHWSPFEMVSICLEIETTRDIARQMLRHRSFSFQEFSQRYAVVTQNFDYREARIQDAKNRQNSIETENPILHNLWFEKQTEVGAMAQEAYTWALDNGIAKEQARCVLPEGMTPSRLYMNGTLRSWIHYIQLRSGNGTQKEHKLVAIACAKAIEPIFPMIQEFIEN